MILRVFKMLSILETGYEKNTPFKDKVTLLQSAANLELLCSPNPDVLTKILVKIKLFLDDGATRFEGLLLLHSLISQCSEHVFEQNAMYWLQSVFQVIRGTDSNSKEISCSILKTIIKNLVYFPVLQREIGEKMIPDIVVTLIGTSSDDQWIANYIQCLAVVMKEMSKYCVPFKHEIEMFLVKQLDCSLNSEVEPLAECYLYLPNIGESSHNNAKYTKYWGEQVAKMIGSLNNILNSFYDEISDDTCSFPLSLPLPSEPEDEISAALFDSRRFQTIARCLAKMLCSETKCAVQIPVCHCLQIIDRCLSVSFQHLHDARSSRFRLMAILPVIHSSALVILEALILTCHDFLILHEEAIGKLLFQNLQSQFLTGEKGSENIQCSMLRVSVYRLLRLWIEKLHPISVKTFHQALLTEILKDITPVTTTTNGISSLRDNGQALRNRSRGLMKKSACNEALALLSSILHNASGSFTKDSFKVLQETMVDLLLQYQQGEQMVYPYVEDDCRLALYRVFLHLVVHSHLANYSPLPVAISIFHLGQRDRNIEISRLCVEASAICITIIHPERVIHTHAEIAPSVAAKPSSRIPSDSRVNSEFEIMNSPSQSVQANTVVQLNSLGRPNDGTSTHQKERDSEDGYEIEDLEEDEDEDEEEGHDEEVEGDNEEMEDEEMEEDEEEDYEEEEEEEEEEDDVMAEVEESSLGDVKSDPAINSELVVEEDKVTANGETEKAIKENGIALSDEDNECSKSRSNIPGPVKKFFRTLNDANGVNKTDENTEVQDNSHVATGEDGAELEVDDMIQDFIPCSPDHTQS